MTPTVLTLALNCFFAMTLTGCELSAPNAIQGVDGPRVSVEDSEDAGRVVTIEATFNGVQNFENTEVIRENAGDPLSIDHTAHSSITITPNDQNNVNIQAQFSLADLNALSSSGALPLQTLPGGRFIPNVTSGLLPGMEIQVPGLSALELYVGPHLVGLFAPVAMDSTQIVGTFPFFGESGAHLGSLAVIGPEAAGDGLLKNSGFLVLMSLDSLKSAQIQ